MTKDLGCLEVLFRRRTIRKFKEKPIDEDIVRRIVEAGQRAPSACNLRPYQEEDGSKRVRRAGCEAGGGPKGDRFHA